MRIGNTRILLLLVLILIASACGQSEQERVAMIEKYETTAREYRIKKDFRKALEFQQKAVDLNPNDDESLILLGGIYIELGENDNAIETFKKAIQLDPDDAWSHYLMAWALENKNKNEDALFYLKKTVELDSINPMFWTNLGDLQGNLGNNKAKREAYDKALKIDPNYITAYYNLALLEAEEENYKKASKMLKEVIEKSDDTEEQVEFARNKLKEIENKTSKEKQ